MSTIRDEDQFLVQRGTNTFRQKAKDLMSTINADNAPYDYLLIQRGTDSFKVSAKDVKDQLGGGGGGGSAIQFKVEYLVVAGGGRKGTPETGAYVSGGGAGGLLWAVDNEAGSATPLTLSISGSDGTLDVNVSAGGVAQNTTFSGSGFSFEAIAGGSVGVNNGAGGSGAGGSQFSSGQQGTVPGGSGTTGQGNNGATGEPWQGAGGGACSKPNYFCHYNCAPYSGGRGGGGAATAGVQGTAGNGRSSSITGTALTYAAGGRGDSNCSSEVSNPTGYANYGAGEGVTYDAQPGAVILRIPNYMQVSKTAGTGTLATSNLDNQVVATVTGGTATLQFSFRFGRLAQVLADYARLKRDEEMTV